MRGPGADSPFDETQMKVGRRLAIKILNVGKFVLGPGRLGRRCRPSRSPSRSTAALLAALAGVVDEATAAFEAYDYTRALEVAESFFWSFCDDYLELVKARAYRLGRRRPSPPRPTLALALSVQLRLFAPVLPFVTEEVWSWWQTGSVHRAAWPVAAELPAGGDPAVVTAAAEALAGVRKAKSDAKESMRADVETATVIAPAAQVALVEAVRSRPDRRRPDRRRCRSCAGDGPLTVDVVLAPVPDA